MTAASTVSPLRIDVRDTSLLADWKAWLSDHLDKQWRPTEWNPDLLLFTGDPDNPLTSVRRCDVAACDILTMALVCAYCTNAHKASGMDLEEFKATYVPPKKRLNNTPHPCGAAGGTCGRQSRSRNACISHYQQWHYKRDQITQSFAEWLNEQPALPPLPMCSVLGCPYEARQKSPICALHLDRWRSHRRKHHLPDTPAERDRWLPRTTPYLDTNQFSLNPLTEVVRLELLYALQAQDSRCETLQPRVVRCVAQRFTGESIAYTEPAAFRDMVTNNRPRSSAGNIYTKAEETKRDIDTAFGRFRGIDPATALVWDLRVVDVRSPYTVSGHRKQPGKIDFSEIRQRWLRDLIMRWAREMDVDTTNLRNTFRACTMASKALSYRPGGGDDIGALQFADMTCAVEAFRNARKANGELFNAGRRQKWMKDFFALLEYGRLTGLLEGIGASFARHKTHTIPAEEANEDEIGKAIPENVLRQLDKHLDTFGAGLPYGPFQPDDVQAMFRTIYETLRDTGRRPQEVTALPLDCLECENGDWSLIWDNRKSRRLRRRLPVAEETAHRILDWRERRARMNFPPRAIDCLFPNHSERVPAAHVTAYDFSRRLRKWADKIPELHSEIISPDGHRMPFDRSLIYPYAYRHSYAQRHADAGTPVDVLKELMDHKSVQTTMGYYKVSLKRKREAVKTIRLHAIDRHGRPAPMSSDVAYELRSVAVPFGNCQEPSNVKAGGKSCPIRFQCAGCGFYRPDPSYLPAIEDHVRSLKADRENALVMDADEFVTRNIGDQITAFQEVATIMCDHMSALADDEKEQIEEASRILRKVRAANSPTMLGMPTLPSQRGETV